MEKIYRTLTKALGLIFCLMIVSCSNSNQNTSSSSEKRMMSASTSGQAGVVDNESKANILKIAKNSPDHSILAKAVTAAEIENVLVNAGPLTVFAPVDAAFKELPDGTLDDLMKPENKSKLANILTSHASPASLSKDQLAKGMNVYLATGQYVESVEKDGEVYVNGAKILGTVDASNGVVHIVDKVFLF